MATVETPKIVAGRSRAGWLSEGARAQIKEYAPTFLTEFAVMASQIVAYKLAAYFLGKQGFSEYAVARRIVATMYPLALLGFGVALPRYVAACVRPQTDTRDRFLSATMWCVGAASALLLVTINLAPSTFAFLVFGSSGYSGLVFPISLIIVGLTIHGAVYSYFRGRLLMKSANTLQFMNLAVAPPLCFLFGSRAVAPVLTRIGVASILVSLLGLAFTPWWKSAAVCLKEARILLRYGVPRIFGDFAQMALLGLPAFFVAHRVGVQQAGNVAFAVSVLSMISGVFAPIGLILLPKSSQMIATGAVKELRGHVMAITKVSLLVAAGLTGLACFTAGPLVRLYLGASYSDVAIVVRIVCIGAVPYCLFLVNRNVLDAFHEQAVTSAFLILALSILVMGTLAFHSDERSGQSVVLGSLIAAISTLGVLTLFETLRILRCLEATRKIKVPASVKGLADGN
jgi:O-antigen/teichoic acid export membrane protein